MRLNAVERQGVIHFYTLVIRGMVINQIDADPAEAPTDLRQELGRRGLGQPGTEHREHEP